MVVVWFCFDSRRSCPVETLRVKYCSNPNIDKDNESLLAGPCLFRDTHWNEEFIQCSPFKLLKAVLRQGSWCRGSFDVA